MGTTQTPFSSNLLILAAVMYLLGGGICKVNADDLPTQVNTLLQQRERHLQYSTFAWQVVLNQSAPDRPQEQVLDMQRAIELQLPIQLRKEGITDENLIHKQVETALRQVPASMRGFSYSSTNVWHFVRSGTKTLVTGTKQLGISHTSFAQYYDNNSGIIATTSVTIANTGKLRGQDPDVWQSSGESIRYRSLFQDSLGLLPEHYAMLLGLNPLSMYGAKWSLVSTSPTVWTLQTQVKQNNFAPFTLQLMLSRKYGGAPIQMKLHSKDEVINFQVESFQHFGADWIANRATFSDKWVGYLTTNQTYTLKAITQSKPIDLRLSQKQLVHDYRLLGPNLMIQGLRPAVNRQQQDNIVYYHWPGHFPSDEELKTMHQKQHPGEATPDIGQAATSNSTSVANVFGSAMPFAGGVLCLVGGVWMFKQRRAS